MKNTQELIYVDSSNRRFAFNDPVCMELLLGVPDEKRTGRLVQVRKGRGAFGSDIFIIRLRDKTLVTFENVLIRQVNDAQFEDAFYKSNGKTPPVIPKQEPFEGDSVETEFTIDNKWPETGFLIEQPKQPPSPKQSFSMIITPPAKSVGFSGENAINKVTS